MPTAIQMRLLDLGTEIQATPPDEMAFIHSVMAQCALPSTRPPEGTRVWERRQGRATLLVEAGQALDPVTGRFTELPLPYGPKARLLLMHLNSEAVRRQSPVIPVEDSMTAFFRRLMGRTQDGRQVRMLKAQLAALAVATFRLGLAQDDARALQVDTKVVSVGLWSGASVGTRGRWPTTLRLSLDYYDSLSRYAVPLDERAIAALAHSALSLDVYCWLAQRLHRIPSGRPALIPWVSLSAQFSQGYKHLRFFRRDFLKALHQVKVVYPDARLEEDRRGLLLGSSPPPVAKRMAVLSAIQGTH